MRKVSSRHLRLLFCVLWCIPAVCEFFLFPVIDCTASSFRDLFLFPSCSHFYCTHFTPLTSLSHTLSSLFSQFLCTSPACFLIFEFLSLLIITTPHSNHPFLSHRCMLIFSSLFLGRSVCSLFSYFPRSFLCEFIC